MSGQRPRADRDAHQAYDELAVGWALHALEPEDEAVFGAHLPDCARCARTVAETAEVMGTLARDLPPAEPGPALRERLRAAVEQTPQVPSRPTALPGPTAPAIPAAPAERTGPPGATPPAAPPRRPAGAAARPGGGWAPAGSAAEDRATGVPEYRPPAAPFHRAAPRRSWRQALPTALAAAAVSAVLGLGTWIVVLGDARDEAVQQATEQARVVDALLEPGTATIAPLAGDDGRVATVVARDAEVQLVSQGLPRNDRARQVYVVWGMRGDGPPVPLGTFDVTRSRSDVRTVGSTTTGLDDFDGFAISLEPGREAPSAPTVLVASGQVTS